MMDDDDEEGQDDSETPEMTQVEPYNVVVSPVREHAPSFKSKNQSQTLKRISMR